MKFRVYEGRVANKYSMPLEIVYSYHGEVYVMKVRQSELHNILYVRKEGQGKLQPTAIGPQPLNSTSTAVPLATEP